MLGPVILADPGAAEWTLFRPRDLSPAASAFEVTPDRRDQARELGAPGMTVSCGEILSHLSDVMAAKRRSVPSVPPARPSGGRPR